MVEPKRFPLETIVSCVAFYKVDKNLPIIVNAPTLVNLIAFMDGVYNESERLKLLQDRRELVVTASVCGYLLTKQHPALNELEYTGKLTEWADPNDFIPWITQLYITFGSELIVEPCDHIVLTEEERTKIGSVQNILKQRYNL